MRASWLAIWTVVLSLVAHIVCLAPAYSDVAIPSLSARVTDTTGTLSSGAVVQLELKLKDYETQKGSQIAVLIIPTTQPETIEQFSISVAEKWKIGRTKIDDGAILVVAKEDRKVRIEVGNGLEGILPDATCKQIIENFITPRFREGKFDAGIIDGIDSILKVVDGESLPPPTPPGPDYLPIIVFIIIIILFLYISSQTNSGGLYSTRRGGIFWGGGLGGGGGGWSGGGGFSGGGGSFSGGGASGSW